MNDLVKVLRCFSLTNECCIFFIFRPKRTQFCATMTSQLNHPQQRIIDNAIANAKAREEEKRNKKQITHEHDKLAAAEKENQKKRQEALDRIRPRFDPNAQEVPLQYLKKVFINSFLSSLHNHVGFYFSHRRGLPSRWIGLSDPLIFYMFDETKIEDHQQHVPAFTTEQRRDSFIKAYRAENPSTACDFSFQQNFQSLKENGILMKSLENAVERYLRETNSFPAADIQRMFHDEANAQLKEQLVVIFGNAMMKKHSLQHIRHEWLLTPKYFDAVKSIEEERDQEGED